MLRLEDEEGEEIDVPFKWAICSGCRGEGRSSAYLGAFSSEEMRDDPDFAEEYMRGGYDKTCEECRGEGKVKEADYASMTPEVRKLYEEHVQEEYEYQETCRRERAMGA